MKKHNGHGQLNLYKVRKLQIYMEGGFKGQRLFKKQWKISQEGLQTF